MEILFDVRLGTLFTVWKSPFWIGNSEDDRYGVFFVSKSNGFLFEYEVTEHPQWPNNDPDGKYNDITAQTNAIYSIRVIIKNSDGTYKFYINDTLAVYLPKPNTSLPYNEQSVDINPNYGDSTAHIDKPDWIVLNIIIKTIRKLSIFTLCITSSARIYMLVHKILNVS